MNVLLALAGLYLAAGMAAAAYLHGGALRRLDPGVESAGWFFRLLITPGLVALWPLMLARDRERLRGRMASPSPDAPLSPAGLRAMHRRLARILLVAAPSAIALAILVRPGPPPSRLEDPSGRPLSLSEKNLPSLPVGPDFPARVSMEGDGEERRVRLDLSKSAGEVFLLYWASGVSPAPPAAGALLGAARAPGRTVFRLPAATGSRESLRVYALERGVWSDPVPLDSLQPSAVPGPGSPATVN